MVTSHRRHRRRRRRRKNHHHWTRWNLIRRNRKTNSKSAMMRMTKILTIPTMMMRKNKIQAKPWLLPNFSRRNSQSYP